MRKRTLVSCLGWLAGLSVGCQTLLGFDSLTGDGRDASMGAEDAVAPDVRDQGPVGADALVGLDGALVSDVDMAEASEADVPCLGIWCACHAAQAAFCDDFDLPGEIVGDRWSTKTESGDASALLVENERTSPPNAIAFVVAGPAISSQILLTKKLGALGPKGRARVALDAKRDLLPGQCSSMDMLLISAGLREVDDPTEIARLSVDLVGAVHLSAENVFALPVEKNDTTLTANAISTVWTRYELVLEVSALGDGGQWLTATFEDVSSGTPVKLGTASISHRTAASSFEVSVGLQQTSASAICRVLVDNVVATLE